MYTSLIEDQSKLVGRLKSVIGEENVIDSRIPRERRAFVEIKADSLREAVMHLKEKEGFEHISTITGIDTGQDLELIYHLTRRDLILNLKVRVPYERPVVKSISDILNGAVLYEREVHDMVGVVAEGHPNLKPLVLPEHWPEGVHPLLKKWDLESIKRKINGED